MDTLGTFGRFGWLFLFLGCTSDLPEEPMTVPVEEVSSSEYGNFAPDHVVQISLSMDPDDYDTLRNESQNFVTTFACDQMDGPIGMDYTEFQASITMDGESLPLIRVRKKGLLGSQSTIKPSFSINLDEYVDGAELFGTDNLTLNNGVQDPSLIRQCLTYGLFEKAGLPAPRCNFARVSMNGEDLGIYVHVEPVKKSFLRDHFGSDEGDLYEGTLSDFGEEWVFSFDPDTDETDLEMAGIRELYEALDSDTPVLEALEPFLDIEQFLSFWAMETLTGHWDGYAGNRNNYFVYDHPESDQFVFIPWGADATLTSFRDESGQSVAWVPSSAILAIEFLKDDEASERFEARVLELLEEVWIEEEIQEEIDRMEALLATEIEIDAELEDGLDSVRDYVEELRDLIPDALPGQADEPTSPYCLGEMGSVSTRFETTWDSVNSSPNWLTTGSADLIVDWEGTPLETAQTGAVAGVSDGYGILAVMGLLNEDDGSYLLPYMWFDSERLLQGESMDFDEVLLGGNLYYTDDSIGYFIQAAYMGGGSLSFDVLETTTGGTVSGSLETWLYTWQEL